MSSLLPRTNVVTVLEATRMQFVQQIECRHCSVEQNAFFSLLADMITYIYVPLDLNIDGIIVLQK